ncbi:MAG TPA: T9SS type A sorting domain-containing protein, partial [Bacteroidales bacterium]|nr:T9SS type A sorting domain-containing protein [Bacteroidales bacterium]
ESNIYITSVYYNNYTSYYGDTAVDNFGGYSGTFISPADYDYKENILYSNAVDFFGGNSNRLLKASNIPYNVVTQMVQLGTGTFVPFSHVTYSRFSPIGTSTLFVGTQSGRLYKVTNAESEPETIEIGSTQFPTANLSCVAIGESEDNLLVTFSNYGVSSVWLTKDGGATWEEKESNLPDMPIRWALFHPDNNGQAILATEIGVWWTNTLNEDDTEWAPSVDGMANVRIDMLKLRNGDDIVLAATHGRGLFTAEYLEDIYVGIVDNQFTESTFNIYPNPAVDNITISADLKIEGPLSLTITDLSGRIIYTDQIECHSENINYSIKLPEMSSGTYLVNLAFDGISESKKLIVK